MSSKVVLDVQYKCLRFVFAAEKSKRIEEAVDLILRQYRTFMHEGEALDGASPPRSQKKLFLKLEASGLFLPNNAALSDFELEPHTKVTLCRLPTQEHNPIGEEEDEWIRLNVGGTYIQTARSTLTKDPDSMLAKMFGADYPMHSSHTDDTGAFMLDQDPRYFNAILNFLRYGQFMVDESTNLMGVLACARFFQVQGAIRALEQDNEIWGNSLDGAHHTRVVIVACRLAAWIGLSGAVPLAVPGRYKFGKTRKYGNQWELNSHSNELLALILNDLMEHGFQIVASSSGAAQSDVAVYQSFVMTTSSSERWVPSDIPKDIAK